MITQKEQAITELVMKAARLSNHGLTRGQVSKELGFKNHTQYKEHLTELVNTK